MPMVQIEHLDIVFGNQRQESLRLLDKGMSRPEILARTGDVVGVQDATISVEEGEICVLMGLSGSGKSTLLRAVNGLNKVARGRCLVKDGGRMVDMAKCDENTLRHMRTNRVSMVFQSFALMPWLTVMENVAFGLEMQGVPRKEREERANKQLKMVGLYDWRDKKPDELSGGMRQRVGLARAFVMDSDILLMDEPFSALDPLIRSQLQDELIELQKRLKKTIIFVSHDLDEALKIGSKIAIMESARIIQEDVPEQIVLNPATEYVEKFVAHTNPLNVLRGNALMTPIDQVAQKDGMYHVNEHLSLDIQDGALKAASSHGENVAVSKWEEGMDIEDMPEQTVVTVPVDVSMRDAVEIRYHTKLPLVLQKDGRCVGVLGDHQFYHALLGKHFSRAS